MKFKTFILLSFFYFCLFPFWAYAATYSYYFSSASTGNLAGNDVTGDGSEGSPWASLSKAKSAINALSSTDTVNLYFDRGDTWTWDSDKVALQYSAFSVSTTNPIVNIDAYGSGNLPVFDGTVTDFRLVPVHNTTTGPLKWSRFFDFQRDNCSMSNVEIKNVYGHGVFLNNAQSFTLSYCSINNFGSASISVNSTYGVHNSTFEYSTVHTGQQLYRFGKRDAWGGGIEFANDGGSAAPYSNHIHHNIVYDIYGEGIICANAITEYNIVGDTGSIGIDPAPFRFNSLDTVVRYNLVTFSDRNTSIYDNFSGSSPVGIRVYDETDGGDNSSADYQVYGNIIINRQVGIWFFHPEDPGNAFGTVRIYNNIVMDSVDANYRFSHAHEVISGYFENNSSIFYDRPSSTHIQDNNEFPRANWEINGNHFWTAGSSPVIDPDWKTAYKTTDPRILGELSVDWDGQTGAEYYKNINPAMHLNPPSDSPIYALSPLLSMDIDKIINPAAVGSISPPADFGPVIN